MQTEEKIGADLQLDEALFRAWQSGDQRARDEVWGRLWGILYNTAFRLCRLLSGNDSAAEEMAQDAFTRTWQEIEADPGKIDWKGQASFVGYVRRRLIFRCRDKARTYWRLSQRCVALDAASPAEEDTRGSLIDVLVDDSSRPDEPFSLFVRDTFKFVAALREMCGDKPELAALLVSLEEYLRNQLLRSAAPGTACDSLATEELIAVSAPDRLDLDRADMYDHFEKSLGINRNTVYLRMKRIRELVDRYLGTYL
ncbi:MAG TPA: hypothetical protein VFV34_17175 [Blastocatellia bacterium]|nr:hypothetical protein [Blastocatellia bacterium]